MKRILMVHNAYRQPGGEDAVVEAEKRLLRTRRHRVVEYTRHNAEIAGDGIYRKLTLAPRAVWAWDSYRALRALLASERPEVAHFHNTFPLISPAAYDACQAAGVAVVQTLHNYRLLCPGATLRRESGLCEECLGKRLPWPAVSHSCYRGNPAASAAVAAMLGVHHALRTWEKKVDLFIALTEFSRRKFIAGGLPAEKIIVKPNFVAPDPGDSRAQDRTGMLESGSYALFVGRLSEEKGLRTLLAAWKRLGGLIPLRIAGDGPLQSSLQSSANDGRTIRFEGRMSRARVLERLAGARFLVFPSESYEGFPLAIAEAFACGVPVIASRLGAMAEIVEDGKAGLHFTPGVPEDLAAKVDWAWTHPGEMAELGRGARAAYEAKYTARRNYDLLAAAYRSALRAAQERRRLCREPAGA